MKPIRLNNFAYGLAVLTACVVASTNPIARAESAKAPDPSLNVFVDLVRSVVPSVANISAVTSIKRTAYSPEMEDLFKRFFGGNLGDEPRVYPPAPQAKQTALGTGFVIDSSGIILTNNHVVDGANDIQLQFAEAGELTPGKVVGRDRELDVALIRVNTKQKLKALSLGDSDALEVGEYVMAVGNPYGQGHSVSHGIVSAKGRIAPGLPIANYLQIDAPINPGNSGGPLLNLKGEVVGINNAIDPRAQGIGFAIPINFVKKVLPSLETGKLIQRGFIGAGVSQTNQEICEKIGAPSGLSAPFVTQVSPGSPAERAGLQPYDAILSFNSKPVHNGSELVQAVTQIDVGANVPMEVLRNGQKKVLHVTVRARPTREIAENDSKDSESKGAARKKKLRFIRSSSST
ncbi:MAG: trypsin-like peptidase domain-containing protein [Oligoflexia bacterium]|nr:trypsin-like peptidase domain-containing protein [Oligoflexia bacterium]